MEDVEIGFRWPRQRSLYSRDTCGHDIPFSSCLLHLACL